MARQYYKETRTNVPGEHSIKGSFVTAGSGAPTNVRGRGFAVSAPSTGVYTITLEEAFTAVIYQNCHLERATASTQAVHIVTGGFAAGSATVNASFTLETESVIGTASNLTGPVVHFEIVLRKTDTVN